jgi:hypothetical protein
MSREGVRNGSLARWWSILLLPGRSPVIAVCLALTVSFLPLRCVCRDDVPLRIDFEMDHPPARRELTTVRAVVVPQEDCREMEIALFFPPDATLVSGDFGLPLLSSAGQLIVRTTPREFVPAGEETRIEMQVSFAGTGSKRVGITATADFGSLHDTPGGPRYYSSRRRNSDCVQFTVYDDHGVMGWEGSGDAVVRLERVDESTCRESYQPREPVFLT